MFTLCFALASVLASFRKVTPQTVTFNNDKPHPTVPVKSIPASDKSHVKNMKQKFESPSVVKPLSHKTQIVTKPRIPLRPKGLKLRPDLLPESEKQKLSTSSVFLLNALTKPKKQEEPELEVNYSKPHSFERVRKTAKNFIDSLQNNSQLKKSETGQEKQSVEAVVPKGIIRNRVESLE
jgi:hypothetical protein